MYQVYYKQDIIVYNNSDRKKYYYNTRSKPTLTITIPKNEYNKIDTKIKKEVSNVVYKLLYYTKESILKYRILQYYR